MEWQLALQLLQGLPTLLEILTALQKWSIDEPNPSPRIPLSVEKRETDRRERDRSLQQSKILEQWPLGLVPSRLAGEKTDGIPALQVLLAPLYRKGTDPTLDDRFSLLETRLSRDLGDFLSQNYPIADRERPVEFLAGIWREKGLQREGRVKALHDRLFDRPCLLLEPEIVGEGLTLRVAWWGFGDDRTIRVWRVAAGQLLTALSGHEDSVLALAFAVPSAGHPRILFSAGKDRAIKRWQIDTGGFTRTLSGHRQWVSSLALCPRGRVLASGSDDRTIRIWKMD